MERDQQTDDYTNDGEEMMMEAITFDVQGIKCDNPECDYEDMEADFDMEKFHNAPCPKCGANLFTDEDYNKMKFMLELAGVINKHVTPKPDDKVLAVELKMDGSGSIDLGEVRIEEQS